MSTPFVLPFFYKPFHVLWAICKFPARNWRSHKAASISRKLLLMNTFFVVINKILHQFPLLFPVQTYKKRRKECEEILFGVVSSSIVCNIQPDYLVI